MYFFRIPCWGCTRLRLIHFARVWYPPEKEPQFVYTFSFWWTLGLLPTCCYFNAMPLRTQLCRSVHANKGVSICRVGWRGLVESDVLHRSAWKDNVCVSNIFIHIPHSPSVLWSSLFSTLLQYLHFANLIRVKWCLPFPWFLKRQSIFAYASGPFHTSFSLKCSFLSLVQYSPATFVFFFLIFVGLWMVNNYTC